jgi:hypothetical protein
MKYLLLLILTACGGDYVLKGNPTVTHRIEIDFKFIDNYCMELYPTDEEARLQCVEDLIASFLKAMGDIDEQ